MARGRKKHVDMIYIEDDELETDNKEKETKPRLLPDIVHDKDSDTEALIDIVSEDYEQEKKELKPAYSEQGVLRDANGRWVTGTRSANPSGAPSRKKYLARLREIFGEDGEKLIDIIQDDMNGVVKSNRLRCENAWKFKDDMFGKALQRIESEIDARVTSKNLNINFIDAAPRKESEEGKQDSDE